MENKDKPFKTKKELAEAFRSKVLELLEYLQTFELDDSITTIYNNNVEFRLCLIRSKLEFLKTSVSRSFVLNEIFQYVPFGKFLDFIKEDVSENAETIDFISKSLKQSKNVEKYEEKITEVQKKWEEIFCITKKIVKYLIPSK
ncbi:MAG: hypothetical protein O4965_01560 [Trichodesmium sp. St19_bin1]|nr:hypothetical protein [Trichodesmium sp. St19_bin1]